MKDNSPSWDALHIYLWNDFVSSNNRKYVLHKTYNNTSILSSKLKAIITNVQHKLSKLYSNFLHVQQSETMKTFAEKLNVLHRVKLYEYKLFMRRYDLIMKSVHCIDSILFFFVHLKMTNYLKELKWKNCNDYKK